MAQQTVSMVDAAMPCHPDAERREGVKGVPVGVKLDGRVLRSRVACPECGREFYASTQRVGRKVRVDVEPV